MILKASQRAGGNQLAAHLLNDRDNEHVTVHQLRGFAADDLHGAFQEAHAISRGTKCQQYLFSVSFNPPKGEIASEGDFERAADEAERRLGLDGQPRAIVFHEKEGRRHAHVVWSRIDAGEMKAVNLSHFKRKLNGLARDLFLEHEWTMPEGLRSYGGKSPLNFTLAEWQQAKRQGRDPREIKDAIRDCWQRSDNGRALSNALEERGYFLAQGDRRGFVVVEVDGTVRSLARFAGLKVRDVRDKLGDPIELPSVEAVKAKLRPATLTQVHGLIGDLRKRQAHEVSEAKETLRAIVLRQRSERELQAQAQADRVTEETRLRASRFRRGLAGMWDTLTGRRRQLREQNEHEAAASLVRDRAQRDRLASRQLDDRQPLQERLDKLRARHAHERKVMIREALGHWRGLKREPSETLEPVTPRRKMRGFSLEL